MRIKILATALVIAALVTLATSLGVATPHVRGDSDDNPPLPALPEKPELKYPHLGSSLDQLVASVEESEASTKEAAENAPVHQQASVAVTIYLSGNVEDVVKFLEDNGGSPRNVGEDYIEAYVPVTLLGQVSEQLGVIRVREIVPPEDNQGAQRVAGHGPSVHGSMAWNQAGFSGLGVKVGVIDANFGFNDFRGLMGTELPSTVQARCYTDVGRFTPNLADCENAIAGSKHGTLLAEAVVDIAPEASMYIASPLSRGDLRTATDWMVSQGVSVIVSGEAFYFDGPGDGTSPFGDSPLKNVDRAVFGGIVWVGAAGNEAQRTWFHRGPYSSPAGYDFINFDGQDFTNGMFLEAGEVILAQLRWDDSWGGANRDFDLFVFDADPLEIVAASVDFQSGSLGHVPYEILRYEVPSDGIYEVVVTHESGSVPSWIQLLVSGDVAVIQHYTERGSINNPAESANPGMLAVGAAHWSSVGTIEPYSSRGPTPDGRVKPDIIGAACGATALLPLNANGDGFCGTSQSAAHVAGMAALVRQRFPTYTAVEVANYLKEHAEQRESPDPNNTWGHGFAQLPPVSECSAGVAVANAANNPGLVSDCDALLAARDALAGSATLNWSGSASITTWDGVTVAGSPQRVTGLVLGDSQLSGMIPVELGNLTNLEHLSLTRNQVVGTIPPELGRLTNLRILALGGNQLTGPVPTWLGDLTGMQELYLWGNQLTGPIPSQLGDLTSLQRLSLSGNQLTGTIPPELTRLTNLKTLALGGNQLTGPIPLWLGSLTGLYEMYLWGNQLTGPIPSQLASLTNLQRLSLYGNQLTGPVPARMGDLTNLEWLYLHDNQLTGPIPTELGNLANLERLWLLDNQLTGPIPVELGSLANLEELFLSGNQLTGPIPVELASLTNLVKLRLSDNQLSGMIPTSLGSLADLEWLHLSRNQVTGTIPSQLASLANLKQLSLYDNRLTGTIPPELGSLANLETLSLARNQLSGTIPPELASLTNLKRLSLSDNQLSGTIPSWLGSLASLEYLYLSRNRLSGPIPSQLASLTNLQRLSLYDNQLTGTIPTWLGSLASLEYLYLSENQLTGMIPSELGRLTNMQRLRLSENQLTGPIPPELRRLTNLEELFLSGNQLTGCIPAGIAGVSNNDLNQLGLPFCTGARGAPTIRAVTPGTGFLTVAWAAPGGPSESPIIAYDVRHIESAGGDKADANWTVVEDVWTVGSGALNYQVTGLTDGTQYDVQVRAINADGDGSWSATTTGTPATWWAIRSFSPASVDPEGEVEVKVDATGYGSFGQVVETLPPGFSYVPSSLSDSTATVDDQEVSFVLIGETSFTYTVTASSTAGFYSFSGILTNSNGEEVPVGGALTITVVSPPSVDVAYAAGSAALPVRINSPVSLTVTFSESVSGFTVDDIVVVNGVADNLAGGGALYTFDVTPNDIGEITVVIAAGVAEDADGNGNTAASQFSLGIPYDDDGNGGISKDEAIAAVRDYFAGKLTKDETIAVIRLYFSG